MHDLNDYTVKEPIRKGNWELLNAISFQAKNNTLSCLYLSIR